MTSITKNIFDMIIFLSPLIVTMSMRGKTIFSFSTFFVTSYVIFSHNLVTFFFIVLCGRDGRCPRFMCGPDILAKCVGRFCEC